MRTLLYGLNVDYATRNGHFMVMTGQEGLHRDDLSTFQVNMLLANKIPHLLDLQLEERDHQINLYYNITGKRMLTHMLRMGTLSIKQFFSLLYAIVDVIGESNVYMLQEGRYILKEDFIYCGDDLTDVHLTYIPKDTLNEKNSLSVDLQHLASRLIHKVSELSGNGYQELMNYLMEESFNIPVLKQLLLKHRNRLGSSESRSILPEMNSSIKVEDTLPTKPSVMNQLPAAANNAATPLYSPPSFSPSWFEEDDAEELSERQKKLRLPVFLAGFVAFCLIWKLYLDHPQEGWLFICSGLSLLTVDVVFAVLWIWKPRFKEKDPNIEHLSIEGLNPIEQRSDQRDAVLRPFFSSTTAEQPPSVGSKVLIPQTEKPQINLAASQVTRLDSKLQSLREEEVIPKPTNSYYQNLEQRTTLLAPPDATMLLSGSSLQHEVQTAMCPILEWGKNGEKKTVRIEKASFIIGRSGSDVDYEHPESGVSRIHAEITKNPESYSIKDLASRNGTIINGEKMVPYRVYSLQEGDIVKIINIEFVFKMGL
jgi:hypothetical protein